MRGVLPSILDDEHASWPALISGGVVGQEMEMRGNFDVS